MTTPFARGFDYAGYQATSPAAPLPGAEVNADFDALGARVNEMLIFEPEFSGVLASATSAAEQAEYAAHQAAVAAQLAQQNALNLPDVRSWGAKLDYDPDTRTGTDNSDAVEAAISDATREGFALSIPGAAFCDRPMAPEMGDAPGFGVHGVCQYSSGLVFGHGCDGAYALTMERTTAQQRGTLRDLHILNVVATGDTERPTGALHWGSTFSPDEVTGVPSPDEGGPPRSATIENVYIGSPARHSGRGAMVQPVRMDDHRWPLFSNTIISTAHPWNDDAAAYPPVFYEGAGLWLRNCYYPMINFCRLSHHGRHGIYYEGHKFRTGTAFADVEGFMYNQSLIVGKPEIGIEIAHTIRPDNVAIEEPGVFITGRHIHPMAIAIKVSNAQQVIITDCNLTTNIARNGYFPQKLIELTDVHTLSIRGNTTMSGGYWRGQDDCFIHCDLRENVNHGVVSENQWGRRGIGVRVADAFGGLVLSDNLLTARAANAAGVKTAVSRTDLDVLLTGAGSALALRDTSRFGDPRHVPSLVSTDVFKDPYTGTGTMGRLRVYRVEGDEDTEAVSEPPEFLRSLPAGAPNGLTAGVRCTGRTLFDGAYVSELLPFGGKIGLEVYVYVTDHANALKLRLRLKRAGGVIEDEVYEIASAADTGWIRAKAIFDYDAGAVSFENGVRGGFSLGLSTDSDVGNDFTLAMWRGRLEPDTATPGLVPGSVSDVTTPDIGGGFKFVSDSSAAGDEQVVEMPDVMFSTLAPVVTARLTPNDNAAPTDVTGDISGGVYTQTGGVWSASDVTYTPDPAETTRLRIYVEAEAPNGRKNARRRTKQILVGTEDPGFDSFGYFEATPGGGAAATVANETYAYVVFSEENGNTTSTGRTFVLTLPGEDPEDVTDRYVESVGGVFIYAEWAGGTLEMVETASSAEWDAADIEPVTITSEILIT